MVFIFTLAILPPLIIQLQKVKKRVKLIKLHGITVLKFLNKETLIWAM